MYLFLIIGQRSAVVGLILRFLDFKLITYPFMLTTQKKIILMDKNLLWYFYFGIIVQGRNKVIWLLANIYASEFHNLITVKTFSRI